MQGMLLVGLVVVAFLNLVAAPLRNRVTLIRSPERLVLRPQQAAVRLDGLTLLICLSCLAYALTTRSAVGLALSGVAVGVVGWRLLAARRAPTFTFDRAGNRVWRGEHAVCTLGGIEAVEIVPGEQACELQLRFRDRADTARRQRLHRDSEPKVAALQAAIADFLATGPA